MAKPPAFQFYANDFMDATRFWPANAVGLYVRLLCVQWTHDRIPSDIAIIAQGIGCSLQELESCWKLIGPKFVETSEGLVNERLEKVRERQEHISAIRSQANKQRTNLFAKDEQKHQQRKEKEKVKVEGDIEGEALKVEVWPTFDDWWEAYGKKIDRTKCEAKWKRMTQAEREAAYRHTEAYVKATPELQYRRHPQTYLNNANWNDEQLAQPKTATNGGQLSRSEFYARLEQVAGALGANGDASDPSGS